MGLGKRKSLLNFEKSPILQAVESRRVGEKYKGRLVKILNSMSL